VPDGTVKFSPKARVKLSAWRIVKLPPLGGGSDEEWQPKGLRKDNTLGGRRLAVDPCCQSSNFTGAQSRFHAALTGFHSAQMSRISLLFLRMLHQHGTYTIFSVRKRAKTPYFSLRKCAYKTCFSIEKCETK